MHAWLDDEHGWMQAYDSGLCAEILRRTRHLTCSSYHLGKGGCPQLGEKESANSATVRLPLARNFYTVQPASQAASQRQAARPLLRERVAWLLAAPATLTRQSDSHQPAALFRQLSSTSALLGPAVRCVANQPGARYQPASQPPSGIQPAPASQPAARVAGGCNSTYHASYKREPI